MSSKKAIYDDQTNIIELFTNVKIVKGQEIISGDYGYFDTVKNSYKVKSDQTSKRIGPTNQKQILPIKPFGVLAS